MEESSFRHELKYEINYHDYGAMRNVLGQLMELDPNARPEHNNEYHIRSLYFDDCKNSALWEKLGGSSLRHKYRIRIYNLSDQLITLERKSKNKDMTSKIRLEITREECRALLEGRFQELMASPEPLLREMALKQRNDLLAPVVLVDYEREAYISPLGNVRITFDKNVRTAFNSTELFRTDLPMLSVAEAPGMILEVKYDAYLPDYIKQVIQFKGRSRLAISKYVRCRKYTNFNQWEDI